MKRHIRAFGLVIAVLLAPLAGFAQSGPYTTGFQVQNLGTGTATIEIHYRNPDGTDAAIQDDTIPAGGAKTYFQSTIKAPFDFNGSVVILGNQPLAVISNVVRSDTRAGGSYNGFLGGANSISLPLIQKGNSGYNSFVTIQNAGTSPATITITYTSNGTGTPGGNETASIPPGASKTFRQNEKRDMSSPFVGSARVSSNVPVVAVVNQELGGLGPEDPYRDRAQILTYDSFLNGSTTVLLPLIMANNNGFFTGINVQNAGTAPTDIRITFAPNTASGSNACPPGRPADKPFTNVAPGASVTLIQYDNPQDGDPTIDTCSYIGAATVYGANNQPLTAIVNQLGGPFASSYEGFKPSAGAAEVRMPLVNSRNSGYFSGIQIQNAGDAPTNVKIEFSPNVSPAPKNQQCATIQPITIEGIPARGSRTVNLETYDQAAVTAGFNGCSYVGSATITATTSGGRIVAIHNQLSTSVRGDQLFTYNAFVQ